METRIAPEQRILRRRNAGECHEIGECRKRGQCGGRHAAEERGFRESRAS
jgi:hypothetical protein